MKYQTDLNTNPVLPCKYMILKKDAYVSCALMPIFKNGEIADHAVCQALNPNLDTITIKATIKPSKISFAGNPDEGSIEAQITDYETKIESVDDPKDTFNLDEQCPARYDWETVNLKIDALFRQFTIDDIRAHPEKAEEINRLIHRLYKEGVQGAGG